MTTTTRRNLERRIDRMDDFRLRYETLDARRAAVEFGRNPAAEYFAEKHAILHHALCARGSEAK